MKLLKYKAVRFILFVMLWIALGFVISIFSEPAWKKPTKNFMVCAISHQQSNPKTFLIDIQQYHQNKNTLTPCQDPIIRQSSQGLYQHELLKEFDGKKLYHFLLRTYNDSLADSVEYRYQVHANNIEPLAWRHGGNQAKIMSYFFGLILTMMTYAITKRIYQKYLTKKG